MFESTLITNIIIYLVNECRVKNEKPSLAIYLFNNDVCVKLLKSVENFVCLKYFFYLKMSRILTYI